MLAVPVGPPLIVGEMRAHVRLYEFRFEQVFNVVGVVTWSRHAYFNRSVLLKIMPNVTIRYVSELSSLITSGSRRERDGATQSWVCEYSSTHS